MRRPEIRPVAVEEFVLDLPPAPECVAIARLFSASVARHFWIGEEQVEDLKIVVSEACTNSVKAHQGAGIGEPVRIVVRVRDGSLLYEVIDEGPGIDLGVVDGVATDAATPAQGLYEGSLGLILIRAIFPDAEILRNSGRGTTVRFALDIPAGYAGGY